MKNLTLSRLAVRQKYNIVFTTMNKTTNKQTKKKQNELGQQNDVPELFYDVGDDLQAALKQKKYKQARDIMEHNYPGYKQAHKTLDTIFTDAIKQQDYETITFLLDHYKAIAPFYSTDEHIVEAAKNNDLEAFTIFAAKQEYSDSTANDMFREAAKNHHLDMLDTILDRFDVEKRTITKMYQRLIDGPWETVKYLLDKGADPAGSGGVRSYGLINSMKDGGGWERVRKICRRYDGLLEKKGDRILKRAFLENAFETVKFCYQNNVDFSSVTPGGYNDKSKDHPLQKYINQNYSLSKEVIELVEEGRLTMPTSKPAFKRDVTQVADYDAIEYLYNEYNLSVGSKEFYKACEKGNIESLQATLEKVYSPNTNVIQKGFAQAVRKNDIEVIKYLARQEKVSLDEESEAGQSTPYSNTPLNWAIDSWSPNIALWLVKNGCSLETSNIEFAIDSGRYRSLDALFRTASDDVLANLSTDILKSGLNSKQKVARTIERYIDEGKLAALKV